MMLSNVLKSDTASKISINIIKAFVSLRRYLKETSEIFQRFDIIEKRQIKYELETDNKIEKLCNALENKQIQPKQGIFFNGQIFDAHKFVSDLVRSAEKSIVLIDNFVDDTVLTLFSKRKSGVTLKDLGKKWFDFSKMDIEIAEMISKI